MYPLSESNDIMDRSATMSCDVIAEQAMMSDDVIDN